MGAGLQENISSFAENANQTDGNGQEQAGTDVRFSLDGYTEAERAYGYGKNLHERRTWIQDDKSLYLNKEKIQSLINQQRTNLADVKYLDLDSIENVIQNFENANFSDGSDVRFSVADVWTGSARTATMYTDVIGFV